MITDLGVLVGRLSSLNSGLFHHLNGSIIEVSRLPVSAMGPSGTMTAAISPDICLVRVVGGRLHVYGPGDSLSAFSWPIYNNDVVDVATAISSCME